MLEHQQELNEIFDQNGPLARALSGYQPRPAQVQMAQAVFEALDKRAQLVVEAGTGTGKTFAYLIPILLSEQKVIISTGTKTLQDQLFFRDLPRISKILQRAPKTALLKGRANYLCLHRLHESVEEGRFHHRKRISELMTVREWSFETRTGDLAECTGIEERSPIIPSVTSTSDNCLGGECPFYEDCYLVRARKRAQKADIVVVNHHLFFADQALRERSDQELVPKADAVIFDEAHQLNDVATQFLGKVFSSRQVAMLAQDMQVVLNKDAPDDTVCYEQLQRLAALSLKVQQAFGTVARNTYATIRFKPKLQQALAELGAQLAQIATLAEALAVRSKDLESCWQRVVTLHGQFVVLTGDTPEGQIHWYELTAKHFRIHLTPLSVADAMREMMGESDSAWIFTSATLATGPNDFSLFQRELGVKPQQALQLQSPFNYPEQSLMYLPPGMPEPRHPDFIKALVSAVQPVLRASKGRTFLLFTSYRAMQEAYDRLSASTSYQLFLQGSTGKAQLLDMFIKTPNSVLLGTSSFWEGVDVRGDALQVVVIDKLPFSVPDEPIIKARVEAMRKAGREPFRDFQLPQAILSLKQGAGRLIRDLTDRGVLVLCDPRLTSQYYGKLFLQSLPPMPITDNIQKVTKFFEDRLVPTES